ncbi:MAG TPA: hypothetical protein VGA78_15750 [Gemmatimonadales bacterium]
MPLMLLGLLLLLIWGIFTFITPAGLGIVHLLLAAGILLLIRGWVAWDARLATKD